MPSTILLPLLLLCAVQPQEPDPEVSWAAGRRVEAIEILTAKLQAQPQDEALRLDLAGRQIEVHWYAAALETLVPLGAPGRRLRGLALYRLGRWEEALDHLSPAEPDQALMRIEALEALGQEEPAAAALESARSLLGPADPRLLGYEARALARRGEHAAAVPIFEAALAADELDAAALYGLGRSLVTLGERERGLELLERHRRLVPLLDRLDFARRGVDLAPLHAPNLAALGDAERALGRSQQAEAHYRRALDLVEGDDLVPIALRLARLLHEDRRNVDAAVRALETCADRRPDARLYVRAGDLLLAEGRAVEAVQRFLRASELRPSDEAIRERIEAARAAYRREPDR